MENRESSVDVFWEICIWRKGDREIVNYIKRKTFERCMKFESHLEYFREWKVGDTGEKRGHQSW